MKPSSGNDICGCDICWKARYDGTPGGAGVVQTGKYGDVVGEIDQAGRVWNMLQVC